MANFDTPLDILDFPRAALFTQAPGSDRDRASFNAGMFNNNPRFTVWTRVAEDMAGRKKGKIDAGIGILAMRAILDQMEAIFSGPAGGRNDAGTLVRNRDEDTGDQAPGNHLGSVLYFGKSKEGICWVSLWDAEDDTRPRIVFQFTGFEYHPFKDGSGQPFSDVQMSQIHALAWVRYLRDAFTQADKGQTPEQRKAQSEAWKARKNGGKGSNQSFQSRPKTPASDANFGDDIPY